MKYIHIKKKLSWFFGIDKHRLNATHYSNEFLIREQESDFFPHRNSNGEVMKYLHVEYCKYCRGQQLS